MKDREPLSYPARLAHAKWLERGRAGEGRLVAVEKDLAGVNESGARLVGARFERCSFDGGALHMSNLDEIELVECRGEKGTLARNRMYNATIVDCVFLEMAMWRLRCVDARIERSTFLCCMLEEACIVGSELTDTKLTGSNLRFVQLDRSRLLRCDLSTADLTGATAKDTHFEGCDLRGALGAELVGATFTDCLRD